MSVEDEKTSTGNCAEGRKRSKAEIAARVRELQQRLAESKASKTGGEKLTLTPDGRIVLMYLSQGLSIGAIKARRDLQNSIGARYDRILESLRSQSEEIIKTLPEEKRLGRHPERFLISTAIQKGIIPPILGVPSPRPEDQELVRGLAEGFTDLVLGERLGMTFPGVKEEIHKLQVTLKARNLNHLVASCATIIMRTTKS